MGGPAGWRGVRSGLPFHRRRRRYRSHRSDAARRRSLASAPGSGGSMSPVTQYIYNGKQWQAEDAAAVQSGQVSAPPTRSCSARRSRSAAGLATRVTISEPSTVCLGRLCWNRQLRRTAQSTVEPEFANSPEHDGRGPSNSERLFRGSSEGFRRRQLIATASSVSGLKLDSCEFRPSKPGDQLQRNLSGITHRLAMCDPANR